MIKIRTVFLFVLYTITIYLLQCHIPMSIFTEFVRNVLTIIIFLSLIIYIILLNKDKYRQVINVFAHNLFIILTFFCILLSVNKLFFSITKVNGLSMSPNIHDSDYLIIKYQFIPKRFDIVILNTEDILDSKYIVKRIIGLPGENVEIMDNNIYVNGALLEITFEYYGKYIKYYKFEIPNNNYLLLGDNRTISLDSRSFGCLEASRIIGKVLNSR